MNEKRKNGWKKEANKETKKKNRKRERKNGKEREGITERERKKKRSNRYLLIDNDNTKKIIIKKMYTI